MPSSYLSFSVRDLPPKKDAAGSMWSRPGEIPRIKTLRRLAYDAMDGRPPLEETLEIRLILYADPADGDLDALVSGLLDGLQAAHKNTPIDLSDWLELPVGALPSEDILFTDDRWVDKITAERLPPDEQGKRYYVEVFRF